MMKFFRDIIVPIAIGLVIFAAFRSTVGSFKVYGASMWPAIGDGEYVLVSKAAYFFKEPQRGDIIVFRSPRDTKTDLIKRVIGVPGDTVEVRDKIVFVNDTPLIEPYIVDPPNYLYPLTEIPPNHYFVLGDNRNNSSDSHKGWTVPRENIIGKAWITYWPPYEWKVIRHYSFDTDTQAASSVRTLMSTGAVCLMR